jgi:Xaa-Pro aminopeptidase
MHDEIAQRLTRFRHALVSSGIDAAIVGPSADFRYLTGHPAASSERLLALVVPQAGETLPLGSRTGIDALQRDVTVQLADLEGR